MLSINELKEYLQPLIHFGEMELKIINRDVGKKIEVFERDDYEYTDHDGEKITGGDLTKPYALITDTGGKIGFIEHPYGAFTRANKKDIIYLLDLIGIVIAF